MNDDKVRCAMCGAETDEDDAVKCASCGALLCPGCDLGGFCANCALDDLD
jgi:hypothetical protein